MSPLSECMNESTAPVADVPDEGADAPDASSDPAAPVDQDHDDDVAGGADSRMKRGWAQDEDQRLHEAVARHGERNWPLIAKHVRTRRDKQCRERWCNHLRPDVRKGDWTPLEDELIIRQVQETGKRWSHIAATFPGRTAHAVKNRYNLILRWQRSVQERGLAGPDTDSPAGPLGDGAPAADAGAPAVASGLTKSPLLAGAGAGAGAGPAQALALYPALGSTQRSLTGDWAPEVRALHRLPPGGGPLEALCAMGALPPPQAHLLVQPRGAGAATAVPLAAGPGNVWPTASALALPFAPAEPATAAKGAGGHAQHAQAIAVPAYPAFSAGHATPASAIAFAANAALRTATSVPAAAAMAPMAESPSASTADGLPQGLREAYGAGWRPAIGWGASVPWAADPNGAAHA